MKVELLLHLVEQKPFAVKQQYSECVFGLQKEVPPLPPSAHIHKSPLDAVTIQTPVAFEQPEKHNG